ncbi:hypothetical protein C0995_000082 [Termitomyces sp. Mi166|nr:hypothetical protein C0995_000082 [Termitomyces sp. Mi166\
MSLLANILGFSAFGLAARIGQLMIQKRNILDNPGGHLISMGVFGYGGYWAYHWEKRSAVLIEEKRAQILERRQKALAEVKAKMAEAAESE